MNIPPERIFNLAKSDSRCNTAYPYKRTWTDFKAKDADLFEEDKEASFYFHIPFCESLCHFCEYTRYQKNPAHEQTYLKILFSDFYKFVAVHPIEKLHGFDIGGGTPTALDLENFTQLMKVARKINSDIFPKGEMYEPSIEGTFNTIDGRKLALVAEAGFRRMSFGIQTSSEHLLLNNDRKNTEEGKVRTILDTIRAAGIEKVNCDFMYGLPGQNTGDLSQTVDLISRLSPEQITLYEMRYNRYGKPCPFDKKALEEFYAFFFENLKNMGYHAHFGSNTFSKNADDLGLSSYIRSRMIDNVPYKGFGLSAQSKSNKGVSYNIGKEKISIEEGMSAGTFFENDIYLLPKEEQVAKYVCVSLYHGKFKLSVMENILNADPVAAYAAEFDFLQKKEYVEIKDDEVKLTHEGFKYFGAVGALFYGGRSKKKLSENQPSSLDRPDLKLSFLSRVKGDPERRSGAY